MRSSLGREGAYSPAVTRACLCFASCLSSVFNRKRVLPRTKRCIQLVHLFGLFQSGTVLLTCTTLMLWKITGQLFCRLPFSLALGEPLCLIPVMHLRQECDAAFLSASCWLGLGLMSPATDGAHFDHLTEGVSPGFSTVKLLVFLLLIYLRTHGFCFIQWVTATVASRNPFKLAFPFFFVVSSSLFECSLLSGTRCS